MRRRNFCNDILVFSKKVPMRSDTDFLHAPTGHLHLLLIPLCTLFFIIVILSYLCLSSISDRRCKVIADPQLGQVLLVARSRFLCKKAIRFSTLPKITGPIDSMLKAMAMYYTFLSFFLVPSKNIENPSKCPFFYSCNDCDSSV